MISKKQHFVTFLEKISFFYIIFVIVSTSLFFLINIFVSDLAFHGLTGCHLLEPAPFPGAVCEKSLTGSVIKSILNFPINFIVTSIFGFFSIKGVGLLLSYWAPIIFFLVMRRKRKNNVGK